MISYDKFKNNFDQFVNSLPAKPIKYTSDYPFTLREALVKYCRKSTVHLVEIHLNTFQERNWPLPLFINPYNIRVGFFNKIFHYRWSKRWKLKPYDWISIPFLRNFYEKDFSSYDNSITEMFVVNLKFIKNHLTNSKLLNDKVYVLEEIFASFEAKHWASCICTTFPLLDFVSRKLLKTINLKKDIKSICRLFDQIGFTSDNAKRLTPMAHYIEQMDKVHDKGLHRAEAFKELSNDLEKSISLFGPALRSFIVFANSYYGYYKEDSVEKGIFNRHAILHGSINDFATKVNAIKLLSFLYLTVEVESALTFLLNES